MTVQLVVPLVIVMIADPLVPLPLQPPEPAIVTGKPELAVAATAKFVPYTALPGAGDVTLMVWSVLTVCVYPKEPLEFQLLSPP